MLNTLTKGLRILWTRLTEQGLRSTGLWFRDHLLRTLRGVSPARTSRVLPNLYVGGQHRNHGLQEMARCNISSVVNMRSERDDRPRGVALERYLWLPTDDDHAPTLEQLQQGVAFIRAALAEERGVYVHCGAGVGRAATMAAAYLVDSGQTPQQAWDTIRSVRPFVRPSRVQIEQLERFAAELEQRNDGTASKESAEKVR